MSNILTVPHSGDMYVPHSGCVELFHSSLMVCTFFLVFFILRFSSESFCCYVFKSLIFSSTKSNLLVLCSVFFISGVVVSSVGSRFLKGQTVNIFSLAGHSVSQLCCCSSRAAIDDTYLWLCPNKTLFKKQVERAEFGLWTTIC